MSTGTGGGARVAGMSAQLDVDALPLFVGHGRFVTSGPLHFGVKQEQIHWKTICASVSKFLILSIQRVLRVKALTLLES